MKHSSRIVCQPQKVVEGFKVKANNRQHASKISGNHSHKSIVLA